MLAHSTQSLIRLQLPASIDPTSSLLIIVHIRDSLDCVVEYNLSSIIVLANLSVIDLFVENLFKMNNSFEKISQMINSIANIFNELNEQSIRQVLTSKSFCFLHSIQMIIYLHVRWNIFRSYPSILS